MSIIDVAMSSNVLHMDASTEADVTLIQKTSLQQGI